MSKELASRLHALDPAANVVIFVRHQVDIIASAYAQYVKRGGTHRPERFLFPGRFRKGPYLDPGKKPLFAFEHFTYVGLIRHYRQLFGADRVRVFAYEDLRRDMRAFLADYARRLGLTVDLERVALAAHNTSFRQRTLALARLLFLFTYRGVADKRYLLPTHQYPRLRRALERFDASGLAGRRRSARELLGPRNVAYIEQYYAPSNPVLAAETGLALAQHGYPGLADAATPAPIEVAVAPGT